MSLHNQVRAGAASVIVIMGLLSAATASAQSAVGQGPLTGTLTDTEPTAGVLRLGPVKLAPGVTIRQLGWDDNVFDEPESESPKEDYVAELQPDMSMFTRLRFVQFSAYGGAELIYYNTYDSESSTGYMYRGRADFLLSRLRPFIGAGETKTRTRPNGEIDTRADRLDQETSGGLAFDLSPHSLIYASTFKATTLYENTIEDGVDLGQSLSRDMYNYQGGLKTDLTPLLSLQLFGAYQEDKFRTDPLRNARGTSGTATFRVAPDAVFTGIITVSYKDIKYDDPGVKPFKDMIGNAIVTFPFLEVGRFSFALQRGVEYSFDTKDAYYVENSGQMTYTHRIFGQVDVQGRIARSVFDYSARLTEPPHKDDLDTAAGSLGYNLRNRTRVAMNYEYTRRESPAFSDRNYQRRRIYLSWVTAF